MKIRTALAATALALAISPAAAFADNPGQGSYGPTWAEPLTVSAPVTAPVTTLASPRSAPAAVDPQAAAKQTARTGVPLPLSADFWAYWDAFEASQETSESAETTATEVR